MKVEWLVLLFGLWVIACMCCCEERIRVGYYANDHGHRVVSTFSIYNFPDSPMVPHEAYPQCFDSDDVCTEAYGCIHVWQPEQAAEFYAMVGLD